MRRLVTRASDGSQVPLTVLIRKGHKLDGSAPLCNYGYGSYGPTVEAEFPAIAIAAVDQGCSYAIGHVLSGAERSSAWAHAVARRGERKTFSDFITCVEYLIARALHAQGPHRRLRFLVRRADDGMDAVYIMRPDLWAGTIARVPFLDVQTTLEHFEDRPLGTTSFLHWGDPRIPEDHAYMAQVFAP